MSKKKYCLGCGVLLQNENILSEGYVIDNKEYVVNVGNGDNKLILNNYVISNNYLDNYFINSFRKSSF